MQPENLLLDKHLNIKLCDFGWAAENISTPRSTFCGTYEYMAPEMIFGNTYDFRVDTWALGILLY
jgi:serine/threonine protein kinase